MKTEYYADLDRLIVYHDCVGVPLHVVDMKNGLCIIPIPVKGVDSKDECEYHTGEIGVVMDARQAMYLRNTLDDFIWVELNRNINAKNGGSILD